LGVLLLVQGLSGTVVAFRDELNHLFHHAALTVEPAPAKQSMQAVLEMVRVAHPQLHVQRIEYPRHPHEAVILRLEDSRQQVTRYVAVDPYRAVITRDAPLRGWPVEWFFWLHQQLLAGEGGHVVVGVTGVALFVMCLSAPFVWWPGWRRLRSGFTVNLKQSSYRAVRDVHRVGGIAVLVILLTIATTGIGLVWRAPLQAAVGSLIAVTPKPSVQVAARSDRRLLPIDALVASAQERYANAPIRNVRFPGGHDRIVVIYADATSTTRPRATNQIWYDGYTGAVLGTYEPAALPSGNLIFDALLIVHTGEIFGWFGRLLVAMAALMLVTLAISGVWQWWLRRRLARDGALPRQAPLSPRDSIEVRIERAWNETARVRVLALEAIDRSDLPAFTAGAHIDVYFDDGMVRQYSLSGDPNDRSCYCVAVLRAAESRGGSLAVHAMSVGTTLHIGAPRNTFMLDAAAPAAVLIAGGIGVTPILAMAAQLAASKRIFSVHYAVRRAEDAAFADRLRALTPADSFALYAADASARMDIAHVLSRAPLGSHVYVCGPERMINDVLQAAHALQWEQRRIHFELFAAPASDPDAQAFDLHLQRSGRILHVPARRTALEVLTECGVSVPASCRVGVCGTCATTVLDGVPDHRDRFFSEEERKDNGVFTPCCSRSRTPVLLIDL
jgi:vanillate O-demethylase ferredoxin subunit